MIAACIVNFVLYIRLHIGWDHLTPMLPTSQKWAMGFVLLWLLGLGILLQRR